MAKVKAASLASTPSSSLLTSMPHESPTAYLKVLSEIHIALSKMNEVPDSRPPSPSRQSEKRVESLREKVKEAYSLAGGDPAQGKWGHMANLLQMTCTVGGYRRWGVGVRKSREVRQERVGDWATLDTEQDWFDWEQRQKKMRDAEDARLKAKVETWKANIDPAPDPNLVGISVPVSSAIIVGSDGATVGHSVSQLVEKGKGKGKEHEKDPSLLGFPVVKQSSIAAPNGKKGKRKAPTPKVSQGNHHVEPLPVQHPIVDMANPSSPKHARSIAQITPSASPKRIGDIPELYLPPSFPSQLGKSTPGPGKTSIKPPPITSRPRSQLLLSSPPLSLAASPQSNPSPRDVFHRDKDVSFTQPSHKRARPLTPQSDDILISEDKVVSQALKRARTMPSAPHSTNPFVSNDSSPSAPPLSTSPAKVATPPDSKSAASGLGNAAAIPTTPKRQLPTLTDLLRASGKKAKLHKSMRKASAANKGTETPQGRSSPASCSDNSLHPVPQPYIPGLPAFTQNPDAFVPDFVSTQPPLGVPSTGFLGLGIGSVGDNGGMGSIGTRTAMGPGSDFFGVGYDSQFDLEKHADRVSELLERDVDFAGWLKQIPEDEADQVPSSQAEVRNII